MEQEQDAVVVNAPELTSFSGQRANAQFIRQIAYIADYEVDGDPQSDHRNLERW